MRENGHLSTHRKTCPKQESKECKWWNKSALRGWKWQQGNFSADYGKCSGQEPSNLEWLDTTSHCCSKGKLRYLPIYPRPMENKNPANEIKETPLHSAAMGGHFDICKMILSRIEEKNPFSHTWTPLHHAAQGGYFDICNLIIQNVEDKNPANAEGTTPLHIAAEEGHSKICQLIISSMWVHSSYHR